MAGEEERTIGYKLHSQLIGNFYAPLRPPLPQQTHTCSCIGKDATTTKYSMNSGKFTHLLHNGEWSEVTHSCYIQE